MTNLFIVYAVHCWRVNGHVKLIITLHSIINHLSFKETDNCIVYNRNIKLSSAAFTLSIHRLTVEAGRRGSRILLPLKYYWGI